MNTQTNLAQVLANEFELELARISPTHTSRLAKLGQKTLNLMNKMAITAPSVATRAKKLMIDNCRYTGEHWLENGHKSRSELSLKSTITSI